MSTQTFSRGKVTTTLSDETIEKGELRIRRLNHILLGLLASAAAFLLVGFAIDNQVVGVIGLMPAFVSIFICEAIALLRGNIFRPRAVTALYCLAIPLLIALVIVLAGPVSSL